MALATQDIDRKSGASMTKWALFWSIWIVFGGVSFAVVTAIVTVKGFSDLLDLIGALRRGQRSYIR